MGFKPVTSRSAVQIQALLEAEVIKEHTLLESLGINVLRNHCGKEMVHIMLV